MNIRQQINQDTVYDRYPELFKCVRDTVPGDPRILSFGCSSGVECQTLSDKYFTNSIITGVDINKRLIDNAMHANTNKNISYSNLIDINDRYDLIFALSVLCIWPYKPNITYSFELFANAISELDNLLNLGGYICLYNTAYRFEDTPTYEKYEAIDTEYKIRGFIPVFSKPNTINESEIIPDYKGYVLFKKTS